MALSKEHWQVLLKIAHKSIGAFLNTAPLPVLDPCPPELNIKRGCFITLVLNHSLRGCIGTIMPVSPLWQAVQENAIAAAFNDPRFLPLTRDEFSHTTIEISVLSLPKKISFSSANSLLKQIIPGRHGIIIEKQGKSATFLPSVWKQIPEKEAFFSRLCEKAGLNPFAWQESGTIVQVYTAESSGSAELS